MANNGNNMLDESMQETSQAFNSAKQALDMGEKAYDAGKKIHDHLKGNGNNQGNGPNNGAKTPNKGADAANKGADAAKKGADAASKGANAAGQGANAAGQGANAAGQGANAAVQGGGAAMSSTSAAAGAANAAAATSGAASGAAAGSAAGPVGAAAGLAIGATIGEVAKQIKDPSRAMGLLLILLLPVLGIMIPFWLLFKLLNPFSSTNTVDGDNYEALQVDMAKDNAFLAEKGLSADQLDDLSAAEYTHEHQYVMMAEILGDAVDAGYADSLAQYPAGKAAAKNSITADHDDAVSVYLYNGKHYGTVDYLNTKNVTAVGKDEKELEGNAWDDGNYLTDDSNNGAFDSGTTYIIAAYSVSKGNTSPVITAEDYSYYDPFKTLVNATEAIKGYFQYSGATVSTQLTQKVEIKEVQKVIKYEKKTDSSQGTNYCSLCTANKSYTSQGENNSHAAGTKYSTYGYYCSWCGYYTTNTSCDYVECFDCGAQNSGCYVTGGKERCWDCYSSNVEQMGCCHNSCGKMYLPKATATYYKCSAGHVFGSSNTSLKPNTSGASKTSYTYASEYFVYEVVDTRDENFNYTSYKYTGNIAPFSYQKLLEKMFLDNNPFYEDVAGAMYAGSFGGNAATITAGTEIILPAGLGSKFSYMAWQLINAAGTDQLKLKEQTGMPFDSEGFGKINGRYVIACTTTYGRVGDYIDFYQSDGTVLKCIIGDIKNQADAGCDQWGHQNGDVVVEFIVDRTSWYHVKDNVGTPSNHPELGGKTITKAVNGGSYFTNPDFVQSLSGKEPGETPTGTESSDLQLKVANLAVMSLQKNMGTIQPKAGYCAAWVSGIYDAAGLGLVSADAIDYWVKWKDTGSSDPTRIPVGAAVVGSGSSSDAGMKYGHVGIYVGDTDGDGEGEVVDNIGRITISSLSKWLSWQTTPVYPTYGGCYGPGFIGWVWPNGNVLGSGYDYTGVDPSTLVYNQGGGGALSRAQMLANIMASPYYQWGVYYEYECDHDKTTELKCPECGAEIKWKTKGFLWWKTKLPCFEYVKAEEPDSKTKRTLADTGFIISEKKPYSVSEKIDWYVNDMMNTFESASRYESGFSGNFSGFSTIGGGNLSIVEFALSKVGQGGQESWAYFNGWQDQWCSMFVSFCAGSCGFEDITPNTASCDVGMNWFKDKGQWQTRQSGYEPKPGDFIYFSWDHNPNDAQHVGIVEKVENGVVYTIEGNTGGSSFRDSKVSKKTYSLTSASIIGYGTPAYPSASNLIGDNAAEQIYNYLKGQGLTAAGVAGLMGNLNAESGLVSIRLQGDFSSGYTTSVNYTNQVDSGAISRSQFINNGPNGGGYGLAQWTWYPRKTELYDYAKQMNTSIGDLGMQLEFLMYELSTDYSGVLAVLRTSNDLTACTRKVLYDFENPEIKNLDARLNLARQYYNG